MFVFKEGHLLSLGAAGRYAHPQEENSTLVSFNVLFLIVNSFP